MNTLPPSPAEKDPSQRPADAIPAQGEHPQVTEVPVNDEFMQRVRAMFPVTKKPSMRGFGDLR